MPSVYYVDAKTTAGGLGNTTNSGLSEKTPWSYDKLRTSIASIVAGDIIKFKCGVRHTYPGATFAITQSGTTSDPIIFTYYGNEALGKPIIDTSGPSHTEAGNTLTEQTANGLPGVYLINYSGTTIGIMSEDGIAMRHASAIDNIQAGEWYWNNAGNTTTPNKTYPLDAGRPIGIYWRPSSGNPSNHRITRASNGNIQISSTSNLIFRDLIISGGVTGIYGSSSTAAVSNILLNSVDFIGVRGALELLSAPTRLMSNITIESCTATDICRGFYAGTSTGTGAGVLTGYTVRNCDITNLAANDKYESFGALLDHECISAQNLNGALIERNSIRNAGFVGSPYAANGFTNWRHSTTGDNSGMIVRFNDFDNIKGSGLILGSAVASVGNGGNKAYANIIKNCSSFGVKMNTSSDANQSVVANNVIDGCGISLYTQTSCSGWASKNNISINPTIAHTNWGATSTVGADNNCYYPAVGKVFQENNEPTDFTGFKAALVANGVVNPELNSVTTDPLLDANCIPQINSPALGNGSKWWSGARPDGVNGEPLPDVYADVGVWQSLTAKFHPANLKNV